MKYITLAALLAAGATCANAESYTMDKGGDLFAGPFTIEFTISESPTVTGDYDIIAAYYQVNGSNYNVNAFELSSSGVLTLVRGGSVSNLTDGELTNSSTMGSSNSSTFTTDGTTAYTLGAGDYTIKYLGGTNGSAAANLLLDGVIVASFTGGNHNMNGAQQGGATLTLLTNDSYNAIATSYPGMVPEPSAFGMLAGLGALALVASRRRRK